MGGFGSGRLATRPRVEAVPQLTLAQAEAIGWPMVTRPSNLGQGVVRFLQCDGCEGSARVLYGLAPGIWCCRRCYPVTYRSSRQSDVRVSRILVDSSALDAYAPPAALDLKHPPGASELVAQLRRSTAGLLCC